MTHPDKEYRQMKAWKRDTNMLGCVADAECGIPTRCPCGGTIINEVSRNLKYPTDFDTLPGRKYFTCKNYEIFYLYFRVLIHSRFTSRMMASISVNHGSSESRKRLKC
ncbi:unnamed protein product [Brassica rapa]|uniref:Uncharacterized protein n=1 Tax=Brassica campestris TaxID=3711 RepID=A0A8D9GRP0_BRACM|nr:unnamed protein product [Brassica rapa]